MGCRALRGKARQPGLVEDGPSTPVREREYQEQCESWSVIQKAAVVSSRQLGLSIAVPPDRSSAAQHPRSELPSVAVHLTPNERGTINVHIIYLTDDPVLKLARRLHSSQPAIVMARLRRSGAHRGDHAGPASWPEQHHRQWQQAARAAANFRARAEVVSEARAKIHKGLEELHAELHRQWLEARVKAQRERLALLRAQDLEAYIGLVSQTHCGGRLSKLLGQTDRCFRVLVSRLGARGVLPAADPATDGLEGSAKMWDALAHSVFCLDIEEQPAVLAGRFGIERVGMQGMHSVVSSGKAQPSVSPFTSQVAHFGRTSWMACAGWRGSSSTDSTAS